MRIVFYLFLSFFPPRFKALNYNQLMRLIEKHQHVHIIFVHPALYLVHVILSKLQRFKIFRLLLTRLLIFSSWIWRIQGCKKMTVVIEK